MKGALFIALICGILGWFLGEPIRRAANRLLPSSLGGSSLLPENRLPSSRPWREVLQETFDNWQRPGSPKEFRNAYQAFDQLESPARACTLARLITEWHETNAKDLFAFTLETEDTEFTNKVLQLTFQLDTSESLSFVSAATHDDQAIRTWLIKASEADSSRMRNLIVEHGLATSNEDPLLQFADNKAAWSLDEATPTTITTPSPGESVPDLWESAKDTEALVSSYTDWMKAAPEAARQWATEQGDPALLDLWRACQVTILTESPGGSPRSAYELSLQIANAPQQARAVERALAHWIQVAPGTALETIQQAPLEDALRDQLTQRAQSKITLLEAITKASL